MVDLCTNHFIPITYECRANFLYWNLFDNQRIAAGHDHTTCDGAEPAQLLTKLLSRLAVLNSCFVNDWMEEMKLLVYDRW